MNIVYAMTRQVYHWILPSLRSLAEHNPEARVFILAEDDQLPFETPLPVDVINIREQTYFSRDSVNYGNPYKYVNLLKVHYPSILPVDIALHLDIDTIICDDLTELFETDLTGKWVGAVNEDSSGVRQFGGDVYVNMGVALLNLEQMRKDHAEEPLHDYLSTIRTLYADQDAWNKIAVPAGKVQLVDVRWNEGLPTGVTDHPGICHYACFWDWWYRRDMPHVDYLDRYKGTGSCHDY